MILGRWLNIVKDLVVGDRKSLHILENRYLCRCVVKLVMHANIQIDCLRSWRNSFGKIIIDSRPGTSGRGYERMESEFWNHDNENGDSEEDISSSDDEASKVVEATMRDRKICNARLDEKLNHLLHAEEAFFLQSKASIKRRKDSVIRRWYQKI